MRELYWRLHAKQRFEWGLTASICAIIANAAPQGKKRRRTIKPDDFSPYRLAAEEEKITFKNMLKLMSGRAMISEG